MTKEERKAIKVLVDLGQSFQTADRDPEYIVKYTLKNILLMLELAKIH